MPSIEDAGTKATAFAPAKINLTLHVTGQRDDGYHLLDSLVIFADVGDRVSVRPAAHDSLTLDGPYGDAVPAGAENLVLRAKAALTPDTPAAIQLTKTLPPASGIGGGSSDAAATLRALSRCFGVPLADPASFAHLGADIPVCLRARPTRMSGIGDRLQGVPDLPPLHMVLVNPGVAVPTPAVFADLSVKANAPMPQTLPRWRDAEATVAWLRTQRNDLEDPARRIAPAIGVALSRLSASPGCLMARMSGSGATCFGIYAAQTAAKRAARDLQAQHPDWWIVATASRTTA